MNFMGKGKIILIAHTPCENLYLKDMEYIVFNDLLNQEKSTEEFLQMYTPELLYKCQAYKKILISKIREKTGGVPLAIYRLGNDIYINELLNFEGDVEKFFSKKLYRIPELISVYDQMWNDFLEPMWKKINDKSKKLIICASYFKGDISIELLKFLMKDFVMEKEWKEALSEAYKFMFLMESGRNQMDNVNFLGVRFFPIIKELIQFKFGKDTIYDKYMESSVNFYMNQIENLDIDALYRGRKVFLDRGGELDIIREILTFCKEKSLSKQYFAISGNNMADFFYVRGKNFEIADEINMERQSIAQNVVNNIQVMETYGMYIRRAVRANRKGNAVDALEFAGKYWKKHPEINIFECSRFLNGKAIVLFRIERNFKEAQRIWDDMLMKCVLDDRERSWCKRWRSKCLFCEQENCLEDMIETFNEGYQNAVEKKYYRAAVDYLLYMVRCYLMIGIEDQDYFLLAQKYLNNINNLIEQKLFIDDKYFADYLWLNSCMLALNSKKDAARDEMDRAFEVANRINEVKKHRIMKNLVKHICEKGKFSIEKGRFYEEIVKCC